jgi:phosphatidylglycerophosphate synthase
MLRLIGPSGWIRRPTSRSSVSAPRTTSVYPPAAAAIAGTHGRTRRTLTAYAARPPSPADLSRGDAREPRRNAQLYSPRPLTEGERWTADVLLELRRAGYSPSAWRRFLRRSLERANATRAQRPQLARQARLWGAAGALAWLLACRASRGMRNFRLRPTVGLAWWLLVWRMLDWHLGMAEGGDGRPRRQLSAADGVSLVRFWLVPVLPAARYSRAGLPAVILAGGMTDWLDGALARRDGRTRLGRDLDTTADLALIVIAAVSARAAGRLTSMAFTALCARYASGVVLSAVAVFGRGRRPAVRARPWGALPRVVGLAMCAAGLRRAGTAVLVIGCLVPPRSTAPHLSPM